MARLTPSPAVGGPRAEPRDPDVPDGSDGSDGFHDGPAARHEVPSRSLRVEPGRPGLLMLCGVAVVAAGLATLLTWAGRSDPNPVPVAVAAVLSTGAGPTQDRSPSAEPGASSVVVVAVVGRVVTPGLVTLPLGSRVADAVAAAGGALPDADLSTVNLARVLVDGEQVAVGVPGAPPADVPTSLGEPGLVNLNTASEAELEALPGVGPVLAGRIATYRDEQGGFTSVDQLQEVSGIGPSTFADLQDAVTV